MTIQQTTRAQSQKRHISVGVDKNNLRIQFSRRISLELFNKKQKYLYLGLDNTPENRIKAERIALNIENDIRANKLEKNLKLYLPVQDLKQSVGIFYDPHRITISPIELFEQFCDCKKSQWRESTYEFNYQKDYKKILANAPQNLNKQDKIFDYLLNNYGASTIIDVSTLLTRMLNWGKTKHIIPAEARNDFSSLLQDGHIIVQRHIAGTLVTDLVKNYNHDFDYKGYGQTEVAWILQACEQYALETVIQRRSSPYSLPKTVIKTRCMMRDHTKFKFWTGCRNGEANGLRWIDLDDNFEYIFFRHSYSSRLRRLQPLKTEYVGQEGTKARKFPCGEKLRLLLQHLYQSYYKGNPYDYVFTNQLGNPINNEIISKYWYGRKQKILVQGHQLEVVKKPGIVTQLVIDKKLPQYLTPYSTRHAWITWQLLNGVHINNVAKLAGNSPRTIIKYYSSFVPNLPLAPEF